MNIVLHRMIVYCINHRHERGIDYKFNLIMLSSFGNNKIFIINLINYQLFEPMRQSNNT